jgi:hypothetical protein
MLAHPDVVSYLNQIVEFDPVFNHRVVQRAPVNTGVGTNLHIIANAHSPKLFNFFPNTVMWRKAKAIGTNHYAGMDQTAHSQDTVFGYGDAGLKFSLGANAGTTLHDTQGTNPGRMMDIGLWVDHGARMDSRQALRARMLSFFPELSNPREIEIWIIGQDAGATRNSLGTQLGVHNDTSCLGMCELLLVLGMAKKTQLPHGSCLQRGNAGYFLRWVAMKLTPQGPNNQTQLQTHA